MNDGLEVAVKRCSLSGSQSDPEKLSQEFRTEVELLMNINHRNVVKLIGYCTERREMISVYEYMPNGSLDMLLHAEGRRHLGFLKRLDIMLDASMAMVYLHHEHHEVVLHCDLSLPTCYLTMT